MKPFIYMQLNLGSILKQIWTDLGLLLEKRSTFPHWDPSLHYLKVTGMLADHKIEKPKIGIYDQSKIPFGSLSFSTVEDVFVVEELRVILSKFRLSGEVWRKHKNISSKTHRKNGIIFLDEVSLENQWLVMVTFHTNIRIRFKYLD